MLVLGLILLDKMLAGIILYIVLVLKDKHDGFIRQFFNKKENKMKKEDLKKYNIICTFSKQTRECMEILKNLGFKIIDYNFNYLNKSDIIVNYCDITDRFGHSRFCSLFHENISFYHFKKIAKKILKKEQEKDNDFINYEIPF